uniref:Gamma-aminobutyric acid type B receptor subunit 2 n=1 Tax=Timema poppense TaxID=170557 RepID=A0A7R9CJQ7_TIMPO|nr:unnamed protein product [Timema poppensis]
MLVWTLLVIMVLMSPLVITADRCLKNYPEVNPKRYLHFEGHILDIQLETSPRVTHQMITHIFKIFLEEVLGYPHVGIKQQDYFNTSEVFERLGPVDPYQILSPSAMINLEVWVPSEFDVKSTVEMYHVQDCGIVAPPGRFGWFIPRSLSKLVPDMDNWRVFTNATAASIFDVSQEDMIFIYNYTRDLKSKRYYCEESYCDQGMFTPKWCSSQIRHKSAPCALLLAGDFNATNFVSEHIFKLKLYVKVVWVGPHIKTVTETLTQKYSNEDVTRSLVVLSWAPSIITTLDDDTYVSVSFPPCKDPNSSSDIGCKYEMQRLIKLAWTKLEIGARPAFEATQKVSFTLQDYTNILKLYYNAASRTSYEDLACEWMLKNTKWKKWVPDTDKNDLYIGAARLALDAINLNKTILRDYNLKLKVDNGECKADIVMKTFIDYILFNIYNKLVGVLAYTENEKRNSEVILCDEGEIGKVNMRMVNLIFELELLRIIGISSGPACSDTVEPLAGVTKHFKTVVISYSAEGSSFSDRDKYPYFFRTIGENKQYNLHCLLLPYPPIAPLPSSQSPTPSLDLHNSQSPSCTLTSFKPYDFLYPSRARDVYLRLLQKMNWKQVSALTEDGQKYTEYISHLQDLLKKNNIELTNRKFPRERAGVSMTQYLEELKSKNARIIIADMYDLAARAVMCEAFHLEMTADKGYVWFLPLWLSPDWYDTDFYNKKTASNNKTENISCTTTEMIKAINGHLALTHSYFAPDDQVMQEGKTVGEWRKNYSKICAAKNVSQSNYAGYAYDAVWTYAYALNRMTKENPSYLSDLHSNTTTHRFVELLEATDFNGVSGRIHFLGPSRVSVINVIQWLNNTQRTVGSFYPNVSTEKAEIIGGILELNMSAIEWLTEDGKQPTDGTLAPPQCVFEGIAKALNVSCDMSIVIVNIIGFGFLAIFVLVALIFVKRRYDKKFQETENYKNYMKSLGLDLVSAANMKDLDKWEIARDKVVINRKLGEGAFGTVYGGEAHFNEKGWVAVAVKTLKTGSTTEEKLDFLSEAEVMKRFEHKNIVKLLGVCTKNEPVYTIMEFMLYGDLKTFLLARRHLVNEKISEESDEISSKKLTTMAMDVARALGYLAELKYVHRDVASRNCLVNANRVVKLGDFGMTRPMYESDYYKFNRKGMLPVRWMSPESLALGIFTPSSDVWSFGVLLYEIITFGSFPFQGLSNNQVLEHVKAGNTLTIPLGVKPLLEGLIQSCWNNDHKKRPQASEIVEFLANNPRLLTPCLDIPLSSVQMEDTGQLEMTLPENFRKCSVSLSFNKFPGNTVRARYRSVSGPGETLTPGQERNFARASLENGCVHEPLLGVTLRSSVSGMGLTKYVSMQPNCRSIRHSEEDYGNHDPSLTSDSTL